MRGRTYLNLGRPLLWCVMFLIVWLPLRMWRTQQQEQEIYRVSVSSPSGTFSEELLRQMDDLPGLRRRWAFYCVNADIRVDTYSLSAEIWGVELSEYPLTILKSAGRKNIGIKPALIVGWDFFDGLTDESGLPVSERQSALLASQISSISAQVTVHASARMDGNFADGQDGFSGQEKDLVCDAEFLGIARESIVCMEAAQMKRWLGQAGLPCGISHVELEIQGEDNAGKAQESLQKAGMTADK